MNAPDQTDEPAHSAQNDETTLADIAERLDVALRWSEASAKDILREANGASVSGQLYENASLQLASICDASPQESQRDCRAGCSFCCHQTVPVTAVEVFALVDYLTENWSSKQLDELRSKVQNVARAYASDSSDETDQRPIPCALLGEEGMCQAYASRPLRCQGFHSLCAQQCEKNLQTGNAFVPIDAHSNVAMRAVQTGLSSAVRGDNRDGRYYELHGALQIALETPNAKERWESGEDIFAGCSRPTAQPDVMWMAPQEDGSLVELCRGQAEDGQSQVVAFISRDEVLKSFPDSKAA